MIGVSNPRYSQNPNDTKGFPSPLEVIGVSNATEDNSGVDFSKFPSPLEETGVSYSKSKDPKRGLTFRFRTLARRLGFLTEIKFWGEAITELFPSPFEVTGGAYLPNSKLLVYSA